VQTIVITNNLSSITGPTIIDGYTQPGSSSNTLAAADTAVLLVQLVTTNNLQGIVVDTGGCTVRGLVINGFFRGVTLQAAVPSNVVEGCFIGTDPTGAIVGSQTNNTGIHCASAFNRIGGTQPWQRNVISGNNDTGIAFVQGDVATDNLVQGNFIGTDAQGLSAIPNSQAIRLYSNRNLVGGTNAAARNIISGNSGGAIDLLAGNSNTVQGCYLGINFTGAATLPNGSGLRMQVASYNIIGGSAPGTSNTIGSAAANFIAFNHARGLDLGSGVDFTTIAGNFIYSNAQAGVNIDSVHYRLTGNAIFNNACSAST